MTINPQNLNQAQLLDLLYKDPLTSLNNRRAFDACVIEEVRRARRDKHPIALVLIDIDYFKLVVQTMGPSLSTAVLIQVGKILERNIKEGDLLFHVDKDAFAILLPNVSLTDATKIASKLSRAIIKGKYPGYELFQHIYPSGQITVSIGVTRLTDELVNEQDLLSWADYAIYKAKRRGRNAVIVQDGPPHASHVQSSPLALFETISALFSSGGDLNDKLSQVVSAIQKNLVADVCSLYLLENDVLVLRASQGLNPDSVHHVVLKKNEGLTGLVVETLTPICSRDAASHPRYKYFPQTGEEQFGSYLGVPILYNDEALGVLCLQTKALQDFNDEVLSAIKAVAGLLGGFLVASNKNAAT